MDYIDLIPGLIAPASVRVLNERAELLHRLKEMLNNYDIPFEFNEKRFLEEKLYAACTFQVQSRITNLLEQVVNRELKFSDIQAQANTMLNRPVSSPLFFIDRDKFDLLLKGVERPQDDIAMKSLRWLDATGLRAYVETSTSLVLLGRRILQNEGVKNHSDEFHLFSVNVDVVLDNPVKTAEALVHEASHNILNIFLEDKGIVLRSEPLSWYSPWTDSHRHHRGIVHGFFAFTTVVAFFQRLQLPEFQSEIDQFSEFQKQNLREVLPSLDEILEQYPNSLKDFIHEAYMCVL